MSYKNHVKTKLRQSIWLLLACCCVVFSSAIKKVIRLHADQRISMLMHKDIDETRLLTQNIKDGCREKHEIQALVLSEHKQALIPGFVPSTLILHGPVAQLSLYIQQSSIASYKSREAFDPGSIPLYLLSRRLQV